VGLRQEGSKSEREQPGSTNREKRLRVKNTRQRESKKGSDDARTNRKACFQRCAGHGWGDNGASREPT